MEESCTVCKKWQSHAYWSHMDPKNVKFFVKMEASFRQSLTLPREFAMNFKGQICDTVKLKGPSGKTSRIEVLRSNNTLSFQSGWRDFVAANKIDEHNLLVFIYSGSSSFDVLIFDQSGCEKAAPFFNKGAKTEKETESEAETLSESESESEKASSESDTSFRVFIPPEKISSDSEISSHAVRAKKKRDKSNNEGTSKPVHMKASGDNSDEDQKNISCKFRMNGNGIPRQANKKARRAPSDRYYLIPCKLKLSVAQQKMTDEMATATQPCSKLFVKILSPTDVHQCLRIPRNFADENIEKRSQSISLLLANTKKVFPARYIFKECKHVIGCGWKEFALEYNFKEGDLCLFEVKKLDGSRLAFVVHVAPRTD